MKEHPILFSGEMARAILAGRKTMTRRVVKDKALEFGTNWIWNPNENRHLCPYSIGDRLYVRETFCQCNGTDEAKTICYRADDDTCDTAKWTPSIHMPRSASRITLEVTGVRVERLQQISEADVDAEGVTETDFYGAAEHASIGGVSLPHSVDKCAFVMLWDSINAKRPGYSWEDNPWVWCIEFKGGTQ